MNPNKNHKGAVLLRKQPLVSTLYKIPYRVHGQHYNTQHPKPTTKRVDDFDKSDIAPFPAISHNL